MNQSTNRKSAHNAAKNASATHKTNKVFTDEELGAMKARVQELKKEAAGKREMDAESEVLAKIEELQGTDRTMAKRIHALIKAAAPSLSPRLWYGMPAYSKDGNVICFFQPALKFKSRYATLGFNDRAHLDEGALWPVAYALKELTPTEEAKISALVKKAVS